MELITGFFSRIGTGIGLTVMYSLSWFLGSSASFIISGGRSPALRLWPTAFVLGVMTATVHILYKCVG